MKNIFSIKQLRIVSFLMLFLGVIGSLGLVLHTGQNNKSVLLIMLFSVWALSPFIALLAANLKSKHWSNLISITLYCLIIVLAIGSLLCYSGVISFVGTKTAFVFLVVPLISWFLIGIFLIVFIKYFRGK